MKFFAYISHLSKTAKIFISILGIYGILLALNLFNGIQSNHTLCIFKNLTGIPCPGCGLTRGTLAIFEGNFSEAFSYNILSIPIMLAALISIGWLSFDLIKKKDTFIKAINIPVKITYLIPFFILTLTSWIVNIYRGI